MALPYRIPWLSRRHLLSVASVPSTKRTLTSAAASSSWHTQTSLATSRVQIYTSQSHDPYLNLSAEHFLLQNSHPDSTILFLYTNDPCVVIGRNQNPWLEVNLGLLRGSSSPSQQKVNLVRRRSGGGAVFHDRGNVNYSVICPPAVFDRNKHAEMIVRALKGLGVGSAHVNARHDIVLLNDEDDHHPNSSNNNQQQQNASPPPSTFKISGSAYKLTRLRSLHHGTCLVSSPNLGQIGKYLRSPAEPYIKARGVESVRSPIRNVGVLIDEFMEGVRREFEDMYGSPDLQVDLLTTTKGEKGGGDDFAHEQIQKGCRELMSLEWLYTQTPLFTFSTHPTEDDPRERPSLPSNIPKDFRATITARHGEIQQADISGFDGSSLQGRHIHTITDWRQVLAPRSSSSSSTEGVEPVGTWLNHLLGNK